MNWQDSAILCRAFIQDKIWIEAVSDQSIEWQGTPGWNFYYRLSGVTYIHWHCFLYNDQLKSCYFRNEDVEGHCDYGVDLAIHHKISGNIHMYKLYILNPRQRNALAKQQQQNKIVTTTTTTSSSKYLYVCEPPEPYDMKDLFRSFAPYVQPYQSSTTDDDDDDSLKKKVLLMALDPDRLVVRLRIKHRSNQQRRPPPRPSSLPPLRSSSNSRSSWFPTFPSSLTAAITNYIQHHQQQTPSSSSTTLALIEAAAAAAEDDTPFKKKMPLSCGHPWRKIVRCVTIHSTDRTLAFKVEDIDDGEGREDDCVLCKMIQHLKLVYIKGNGGWNPMNDHDLQQQFDCYLIGFDVKISSLFFNY